MSARVILSLVALLALSGCILKPGGIVWLDRDDITYEVATTTGTQVVTCEWFANDSTPFWEPVTEETYSFQWVCDAIPRYWGQGSAPQTVTNPTTAEVAYRRD